MSVNFLHNEHTAQQTVDLLLKIGIFKYLPQEMPEITHFVGRCPEIGHTPVVEIPLRSQGGDKMGEIRRVHWLLTHKKLNFA